MRMRTRRMARWTFYAAAAIAVVLVVNFVLYRRIDPETVPQSTWHSMATTSESGMLDPLPKEHKVVVQPLTESPWGVLAAYLPPPLGQGGQAEMQGQFDSNTGAILITGKMARLQAGLPFEWARPIFTHTLRHEYGHAFAHDFLKSKDCQMGGEAFMGFSDPGEKIKPKAYPKQLQEVAKEFADVNPEVYGQSYFTKSFDEYLAESYARFVSGQSVPPKTAAFLRSECER